MKHRQRTLLLALLIAVMLTAACAPTRVADCTRQDVFCVGLVTDAGKINDQSINQAAWEAVQQAEKDLGARIQFLESPDPGEYARNISTFGEQGYDVIVTVGPALGEATIAAAATYRETDFIGVDQTQNEVIDGVVGLHFAEDQAGFLVGALAALMTETNRIGAVCGPAADPAVWRYGEGYKAGAAFADQFKGVMTEVYVMYEGDPGSSSASAGREGGAATAASLIGQGTDVIFGCGGMTGDGAVTGAAQAGAYAIGVETDQYLTLPEAAPRMLSSAVKMITPGVFQLINLSRSGQFPNGNYPGEVGYAPFHDLEKEVPVSVKQVMEQIRAGLLNGSIQTNVTQPGD